MKKLKAIVSLFVAFSITLGACTTAFAKDDFVHYKVGDFDVDQTVDVSDVTTLQMQLVGYDVIQSTALDMADFNGDGIFDVADVTEAQKMLVGFEYKCFLSIDESYKNIVVETRTAEVLNSKAIEFENLYYENNLIFTNFEANESSNKYLLKSADEFYSVFGVYSPIFDDEYFAENALYVELEYDSHYGDEYKITSMSIDNNKLFIDSKIHTPLTFPPMSACWHMFYKVKKADVENIDIISVHSDLIYKEY